MVDAGQSELLVVTLPWWFLLRHDVEEAKIKALQRECLTELRPLLAERRKLLADAVKRMPPAPRREPRRLLHGPAARVAPNAVCRVPRLRCLQPCTHAWAATCGERGAARTGAW